MTDPQIAKLTMRCNRRGIKEMDVILGKFAQIELREMEPSDLITLENLLEENDHDILGWILERSETPEPYRNLIARIKAHHDL